MFRSEESRQVRKAKASIPACEATTERSEAGRTSHSSRFTTMCRARRYVSWRRYCYRSSVMTRACACLMCRLAPRNSQRFAARRCGKSERRAPELSQEHGVHGCQLTLMRLGAAGTAPQIPGRSNSNGWLLHSWPGSTRRPTPGSAFPLCSVQMRSTKQPAVRSRCEQLSCRTVRLFDWSPASDTCPRGIVTALLAG